MATSINQNHLELFVDDETLPSTNGASVTTWADLSGKGRHLAPVRGGGYPVVQTGNAPNGHKSVQYLGNGIAPLGTNASFMLRSGFMVFRINAPTFSTYNGLLTTLSAYAILVGGGTGLTTFFDALYPYYEYRLNDRIYSPLDVWSNGKMVRAHNPPAPFGVFAIVYFRFWKNLIVDGIQIGGDRTYEFRNAVAEFCHLSLYSKDFGCEESVREQMNKLSKAYATPLAEVYPFNGSRGDTVGGGKDVLSDGQLEPVTSVISPTRRSFSANFNVRSMAEVKTEEAFYEAMYPKKNFIYRDFNTIPPVDTTVRYAIPQAKEFAKNLNQSGYSREFIQSTGLIETYTASAAPELAPDFSQ